MSINWAMVSSEGTPVPLPREKALVRIERVEIELVCGNGFPAVTKRWSSSNGNLFLTSERVVYIGEGAGRDSSHSVMPGLHTLSVPLGHLEQGNYIQPWFSSNRYEALVLPVREGGIPAPARLQINFVNGGGDVFQSTITGAKEAFAARQVVPHDIDEEALPLYEGQHEQQGQDGQQERSDEFELSVLPTNTASASTSTTTTATAGPPSRDMNRSTSSADTNPAPPDGPPPAYA